MTDVQIVQYVHRSGEALPEHAKVTEVSASTADAVRPTAHGALDALLNDIKGGWLPENADAKLQKERADAEVAAAEAALEAAKAKQADAEKKLAAAPTDDGGTAASTTPTARSGKLPDDFPGRQALAEADIKTYAQLRAAGDPTEIPGIGPVTAEKIKAALAGS
ncbi:MAG TPA: hypothetical protein VGS01_09695 [Candidatus Limnocylindria bacterium]|nr:hypothetical protein [Candidatus Limnocylindria bacterium]